MPKEERYYVMFNGKPNDFKWESVYLTDKHNYFHNDPALAKKVSYIKAKDVIERTSGPGVEANLFHILTENEFILHLMGVKISPEGVK